MSLLRWIYKRLFELEELPYSRSRALKMLLSREAVSDAEGPRLYRELQADEMGGAE